MSDVLQTISSEVVKSCCAAAYGSDWMRWLLGGSFHPGGLDLTERLGRLLKLSETDRVLDVASGRGDSALHLARTFGCSVMGVDYSAENVASANAAARAAGLTSRVQFQQGDAEHLGVPDNSVDAVICECAFCTFPHKSRAAAEFARVLRPAGRLGISDLTRRGPLPAELDTLISWVSCVADAQPLSSYLSYAREAGFEIHTTEDHGDALVEMVRQIRLRLLGGQLVAGLQGIDLSGFDLNQAASMARTAAEAIEHGHLSYALITAVLQDTDAGCTHDSAHHERRMT